MALPKRDGESESLGARVAPRWHVLCESWACACHAEAAKQPGGCNVQAIYGPVQTNGPARDTRGSHVIAPCVRCRYGARFPTREGYLTVRLPYAAFRSEYQGQPPLDAAKLRNITIRYENKKQVGLEQVQHVGMGAVRGHSSQLGKHGTARWQSLT